MKTSNSELAERLFKTSRRSFVMGAGQMAIAAGLGRMLPSAFAQGKAPAVDSGKFIIRSRNPEDFETRIEHLNTWITPNDLHYVRSHLYTPQVDLKQWKLQVDGLVNQPMTLSLDDLKQFGGETLTVTLECSGNGRAFFDPPVAGAQWEKGAVGNARWTGARLAYVLKKAGLKPEAKFVTFDGEDKAIGKVPDFLRSLAMEKAYHPDTLLAWEMNGEPIPVAHGFPLRLIVPGWSGNNSVKWLNHITVTDAPSDSFFMKTGYKYPTAPVAPGGAADPATLVSIGSLVVKSSITSPAPETKFKPGPVKITGIAYAGEKDITGVEVSTDLGRTWQPALLGSDRAKYAWRLWIHTWEAKEPGSYLIMSRAKDNAGNVQPMVQAWNPSGYLWNTVDKVRVSVNA